MWVIKNSASATPPGHGPPPMSRPRTTSSRRSRELEFVRQLSTDAAHFMFKFLTVRELYRLCWVSKEVYTHCKVLESLSQPRDIRVDCSSARRGFALLHTPADLDKHLVPGVTRVLVSEEACELPSHLLRVRSGLECGFQSKDYEIPLHFLVRLFTGKCSPSYHQSSLLSPNSHPSAPPPPTSATTLWRPSSPRRTPTPSAPRVCFPKFSTLAIRVNTFDPCHFVTTSLSMRTSFPNLRALRIAAATSCKFDVACVSGLERLESLRVSSDDNSASCQFVCSDAAFAMPSLRELDVGSTFAHRAALENAFRGLPGLETASLPLTSNLFDVIFNGLSDAGAKLRSLTMLMCRQPEPWVMALSRFKALRACRMTSYPVGIGFGYTNIEDVHLDLMRTSPAHPHRYNSHILPSVFPNTRILNIEGPVEMSRALRLSDLLPMPLEELSLSSVKISREDLGEHSSLAFADLRRLSLADVKIDGAETDFTRRRPVRNGANAFAALPSLRELSIVGGHFASAAFVSAFFRSFYNTREHARWQPSFRSMHNTREREHMRERRRSRSAASASGSGSASDSDAGSARCRPVLELFELELSPRAQTQPCGFASTSSHADAEYYDSMDALTNAFAALDADGVAGEAPPVVVELREAGTAASGGHRALFERGECILSTAGKRPSRAAPAYPATHYEGMSKGGLHNFLASVLWAVGPKLYLHGYVDKLYLCM